MNLQRELEELKDMYEKSEKGRLASQRELEDLISTSSDVGKNVRNCHFWFSKSLKFFKIIITNQNHIYRACLVGNYNFTLTNCI